MFLSIRRLIIASVLALALEFVAFNFIPAYVKIIASRTLSRQVVDWGFNFLVFFVVFYLILTLAAWLTKKVSPPSK
jgi:hypothetical protein